MRLEKLKCLDENIDLDDYIAFRDDVKKHMEIPEWLGDFSKEDLEKIIVNGGKIWVYYLNDEPICSMMMIPSTERSLSKFNLDLNPQDVIDYGPMFVNPKYWGNRLQYQMLQTLDSICIELGYSYAVGTIHPDNSYSIHNLVKDIFKLHNTKEFKRGIRNIYVKKLK